MTHMTPEQQARKASDFDRIVVERLQARDFAKQKTNGLIQFMAWAILATATVMLISCGIQLLNQWAGGAV